MKISSLAIRNFKAIGAHEQRIQFSPVTLLYGPNSAGKSTVVQALHYLSEILSHNNCDPGTTRLGGNLNLGGFRNLVHLHDTDSSIELAVGLELGDSFLPSYVADIEDESLNLGEALVSGEVFDLDRVQGIEVRVQVAWSRLLGHAFVSDYLVSVHGDWLAHINSPPDEKQILLSLNTEHSLFGAPAVDDEFIQVADELASLLHSCFPSNDSYDLDTWPMFLRTGRGAMPEFGALLPLEPTSTERLHDFIALNGYLSRVIVGAGELVRDCLEEFIYLGPLRDIPGRHYAPELSPGLGRWASGLGAWDQLYNEGEELARLVNEWLADDRRLDSGYEISYSEYKPLALDSALMVALQSGDELLEASDWVKAQLDELPTLRQVTLRDVRADIELHPEDLGTGISQVLPVLVAALGHNKNIVAIEQPELHVHPKFQVALGELFIHAAKDENIARDTVFILETHSEYMMLRFLRRLYETANDELGPDAHALTPEDIAVYYVNPEGDSLQISKLRLTEEGEFLDRWPNGFFPERKQELF